MKKITVLGCAMLAVAFPASLSAEGAEAAKPEAKKSADSVDSLADETMKKLNELVTILESVKDDASADKAAKDINKVGDDMLAISQRLTKLEKPSAQKQKELGKKFETNTQDFAARVGTVMGGMIEKPELAQKVSQAMQNVGPKMEKAGKVFEAYFGGEEDS